MKSKTILSSVVTILAVTCLRAQDARTIADKASDAITPAPWK